MRYSLLLTSLFLLFIACDSTSKSENYELKATSTNESTTKPSSSKNEKVSGNFLVEVDGKFFKSSLLEDNYSDMHLTYNGDKSGLTVRLKDVKTNNILMVMISGPESLLDNPVGSYDAGMTEKPLVTITFIENGDMVNSTLLGKGSLEISKFSRGEFVAEFSGAGGTRMNVVKKEALAPFEGKVDLKTKNVRVVGR